MKKFVLVLSMLLIASSSFAGPIHDAVRTGNLAEVIRLLGENATLINSRIYGGYTPLHEAAYEGHTEIARLLLDRGAEVNRTNNDGDTPLYAAALYGQHSTARLLLDRGAEVNRADDFGTTPLYRAAQLGSTEITQLLLDRGANVDSASFSMTPLHEAAQRGHTAIVQLLIDRGADVNTVNSYGTTPLHGAAENGYTETAQLLVQSGADFSHARQDIDSYTSGVQSAIKQSSNFFTLLDSIESHKLWGRSSKSPKLIALAMENPFLDQSVLETQFGLAVATGERKERLFSHAMVLEILKYASVNTNAGLKNKIRQYNAAAETTPPTEGAHVVGSSAR